MTKVKGRPPTYTEATKFRVAAQGRHKLQENSDRRAVISLMIANTGVMTLGEINSHYDFDMLPVVTALMRAGWVEVME